MTNRRINLDLDPFGLSKNAIGFDSIFKRLQTATEALPKIPAYPPYNIRKIDNEHYVIEMAVAGFGKANLDIELKDDILTVTGKHDAPESDYIYQGIANRAFTRQFTLADSVIVQNAELVNGLLKIALERFVPEEKKAKKINIFDPFGVQEATKEFLTESAKVGKAWVDEMNKFDATGGLTK